MCYSSSKDFGRSYKKESDRTPEPRSETKREDRAELRTRKQGTLFWPFPRRRSERPVQEEPAVDRVEEKV
ncbi:hypothetical protein [Arthrobacter sp. B3I4]|uniref:hypothetical protein n=1 Tax=Arthrobacter sp. B3I4 TaxID=3042267 RepID=UPI0027885A59|nr:hypothetical protein [Arthrobacter sp. B3I4]MDQ0756216.1 hypothetical protein [Arthrobacter sp. B3I4]